MTTGSPPRETVVLVHGTFAEPRTGEIQWYELGHPFCRDLDEALMRRGSPARCHAHLRGGDATEMFSWSGRNSQSDRSEAADSLRGYLEQLQERGWICHVIAHSHGGNVLRGAVGEGLGDGRGKYITLGTPFILTQPAPRGLQAQRDRARNVSLALWGIASLCIVGSTVQQGHWNWVRLLVVLGIAAVLGILGVLAAAIGLRLGELPEPIGERWLTISHRRDEVFMLLSALSEKGFWVDDRRKPSFDTETIDSTALQSGWRQMLRQGREHAGAVDRALFGNKQSGSARDALLVVGVPVLLALAVAAGHGGAWVVRDCLLIAALLIGLVVLPAERARSTVTVPLRAIMYPVAFCSHVLRGVVAAVVRRYGRRWVWSYLGDMAFGLEGTALRAEDLRVSLDASLGDAALEDAPPARIVEEVEARRRVALQRSMGELDTALSVEFTWDTIRSVLKGASDTPLVHTLYFDPAHRAECVDRIAKWICQEPHILLEHFDDQLNQRRPADGFGVGSWC